MNFIIFILSMACFFTQLHGYNYDQYNGFNGHTGNAGYAGHNPHMDNKIHSDFERRNILRKSSDKHGKTKHIPFYSRYNKKIYDNGRDLQPTNDPKVNEYILNNKLVSEPVKIDDDDIIRVLPLKYHDKYSFKDNWADSWKDSSVW